jgi:hypothetical protein
MTRKPNRAIEHLSGFWFFLRARDRTIAAVESVEEREMMIQAGLLSFDLTKAADARVASDRVEQDFSLL